MSEIPNMAEVVNNRTVIDGEDIELMAIRPTKHQFARELLERQQDNTWTIHEVDLSTDAKQWAAGELTEGEQRAYKYALAFLSNLDGIQLNNLVNNINQHVTSPEINQCLVRQAWEESLHVEAYANMIESIGFDPIKIYWLFETDAMLAMKNKAIMKQSRVLGQDYSAQNFVRAVVANIALEGVYFYSGFLTFYSLARMGKMLNSAKMIKLIQRDEVTHLVLFVNMWHEIKKERPELFTPELYEDAKQIMRNAVDMEAEWGAHIISGGVPGLSSDVVRQFCEYLGDTRLRSIGIDPIYGTRNPVPWFDDYSQINRANQNNFETKVDAYKVGALEW